MDFPEDLHYTQEHEWLRVEGNDGVVGITDFAQDALGDVVFVELPPVGATFAPGQAFGVVESNKTVSDLFAPVPAGLRPRATIDLPPGLTEPELRARFEALAARNAGGTGPAVFLGAGAYPHWVPTAVDQVLLRSEFLTAYTPYQPEV